MKNNRLKLQRSRNAPHCAHARGATMKKLKRRLTKVKRLKIVMMRTHLKKEGVKLNTSLKTKTSWTYLVMKTTNYLRRYKTLYPKLILTKGPFNNHAKGEGAIFYEA